MLPEEMSLHAPPEPVEPIDLNGYIIYKAKPAQAPCSAGLRRLEIAGLRVKRLGEAS
jgi:hypothetical protein